MHDDARYKNGAGFPPRESGGKAEGDAMLNWKYLEELEEYLKSGQLEEDFKWSAEERRQELLEFLEKLMDLGELADATATAVIFRGSQLGALMGIPANAQK